MIVTIFQVQVLEVLTYFFFFSGQGTKNHTTNIKIPNSKIGQYQSLLHGELERFKQNHLTKSVFLENLQKLGFTVSTRLRNVTFSEQYCR